MPPADRNTYRRFFQPGARLRRSRTIWRMKNTSAQPEKARYRKM